MLLKGRGALNNHNRVYDIVLLPGDGIGPEVIKEAVKVLKATGNRFDIGFNLIEAPVGGTAIEETGSPLPAETIELCKKHKNILFGAVGASKWDDLPSEKRPERAILGLRRELNLYANIRPIYLFPSIIEYSPLKSEILKTGIDIIIIRELTGDIYFGEPRFRKITENGCRAIDTAVYNDYEIERIAITAFNIARKRKKKVTSVDKANVLETSRLWRETVNKVSKDYNDVVLEHQYVDNCAMQLILNPAQFDVILTGNMFGDILSDEASVLAGSIGFIPSASLGGEEALYEPIHGSAPDIAGQKKANPIASILSVGMMFKYSFNMPEADKLIKNSVNSVLEEDFNTSDSSCGNCKIVDTETMGDLIVEKIKKCE